MYGSKLGFPVEPQCRVDDVSPDDLDAVMIPGGFAPESLRRNADVLKLVRGWTTRHVVAAVCHAGWVLASAGWPRAVASPRRGRSGTTSSTPGPTTVDEHVVRDGNLVTSRLPNDRPGFWCRIGEAIADLPERTRSAIRAAITPELVVGELHGSGQGADKGARAGLG